MARSSMVSLSFLLMLAACGSSSTTNQDRFNDLVAYAQSELARQGVPGAAVAVVVDGKVAYTAGVGSKRMDTMDPVHATTTFGIGSTTKMMVASALLSVREAGRVDLDAPITQLAPEFQLAEPFASMSSEITLRELLSHTAGLQDTEAYLCSDTLSQYFGSERPELWAEPGLLYDYSNLGYDLAGLALERSAGEPFAAAMQDRIFARAGMNTTTFDSASAMALDHSLGHTIGSDGKLTEVELDSHGCPYGAPSGTETYTTAPELAQFAAAVVGGGGDVLDQNSTAELLQTSVETHGYPGETYGLGLASLNGPGERVLYHNGDDGRFTSMVALVPGVRFAVVVIMNSGSGVPDYIVADALRLFIGSDEGLTLPHLLRGDFSIPASSLPRYVGTYLEPIEWGRAIVSVDGDHLVATLPDYTGAPTGTLEPVAGDAFSATLNVLPGQQIPLYFWFDSDPNHAAKIVTRLGIFSRTQ